MTTSVTSDKPKNVNEIMIPISGIEIGSWTPQKDGKGKAEQVHLMIRLRGGEQPFVMRIKSRQAIQSLIDALILHRDDVWPES
jgi:hypothetical protein